MLNHRALTEWRLSEYETLTVPDLSRAQALLIKKVFGDYLDVDYDFLSGDYQLKAGHHVGILTLGATRIVIEPKVSVGNLFEMLTYAYDLPQFRHEETPLIASSDLFPFIIQIFLRQVGQLVRQGIYRHYVDREENQPVLRGRLLLQQHLQRNAVRLDRFQQRLNEYTPDLLENQILKYTLWLLSRLGTVQPALRRRLRRALSAFAEVSLVPVRGVDCLDVLYTRLNDRYRTPINLTHLLLEHLSLEAEVGGVSAASFIFDMNEVFERFVAYYLRAHLTRVAASLQIEIQPNIWLDVEHKEKAIPDILLRKEGRRHLVLDTKYKRFADKPSKADLYQMMAYCHSLRLQDAILIYPGATTIHYHRTFPNFAVSGLNLDLDGDLPAFRAHCRTFVTRLAQAALPPDGPAPPS